MAAAEWNHPAHVLELLAMVHAPRVLRDYLLGGGNDWNSKLQLAEFAINNTASTLGDELTPFLFDRKAHPRVPLSPPHHDLPAGESPAHYAQRMLAMEATVRPRAAGCVPAKGIATGR